MLYANAARGYLQLPNSHSSQAALRCLALCVLWEGLLAIIQVQGCSPKAAGLEASWLGQLGAKHKVVHSPTLHVWSIYIHFYIGVVSGVNVGNYASPMDCLQMPFAWLSFTLLRSNDDSWTEHGFLLMS